MNQSRSNSIIGLSCFVVLVFAVAPCVMSGRIPEYLSQPRYLENPALANAYNQVLDDLHDLEAMLTEGNVAVDREPVILSKKEDVLDNWGSLGYPYRIKKNYNLDHLARMNFKRSDSDKRIHPSKFNQRHILGGLRRK